MKSRIYLLLIGVCFPLVASALEEKRINDDYDRWRGCYYYQNETDVKTGGTRFYADLSTDGISFKGRMYEDNFVADYDAEVLTLVIVGTIYEDILSFIKQYDTASGLKYFVMYLGKANAERNRITGTWSVPESGNWGYFVMSDRGYPCD